MKNEECGLHGEMMFNNEANVFYDAFISIYNQLIGEWVQVKKPKKKKKLFNFFKLMC